ncbi:MAG: hypothetical protein AAFY60_12605, partial [Myxococcota bacterium]
MSTVGNTGAPPGVGATPESQVSGNTAASPSTSQPLGPAAGTGDVASVLANAGVVSPEPMSPVHEPRSQPVDRDEVDTQSRSRSADASPRAKEPDGDRKLQRNPFVELKGAGDAEAIELGEPLGFEAEIDTPDTELAKLYGFAARLSQKRPEQNTLSKTLEGMLLLADDALESAHRAGQVSKQELRSVADTVWRSARKGQSLRQQKLVQTIRMMRLGDDPNAFVQRVMRESYALGNERMREFADRLKKANELRKAIRKEAARVREALSQHAGREPTDALLSPVKMMDVDSARMELVDAFRTLETAGEADADIDQTMSQNAEGSRAPWDKEDGLSAGERANLKLWSQDDDYIKENLDEIRSMADRLSVDEFDRHFFPILARLAADDEEEEILDLLGALPAHLRLRAVTREIGQAPRPNWERASGASAYTQSASVGPSVTSEFFGRFDQKWLRRTIREALTGRESRDYERLRNEALDELSHSSGLEMHE